jgi:hypothetical protein
MLLGDAAEEGDIKEAISEKGKVLV